MEQNSKIPLLITKNSYSIILKGTTAEALMQWPRPVLWFNDGMYCWIPVVRIQNMARQLRDRKIFTTANDLPFACEFHLHWANGFPVRNQEKELAEAIVELLNIQTTRGHIATKIWAICGGGDWNDASIAHVELPPKISIAALNKDYQQAMRDYHKQIIEYPGTFSDWLLTKGGTVPEDNVLEEFWEV